MVGEVHFFFLNTLWPRVSVEAQLLSHHNRHVWTPAKVLWDGSRMLRRRYNGKWMEVIIYSGWHCQRMAHQRRSTESGQEALKDDLQRGTELGRRMVSCSLEPSLSSGKCLMSHQPLTSVLLSSSMFYWHLGERVCNTEQTAADNTLDNRERIQDNQSSPTKVSMDTNKIKVLE